MENKWIYHSAVQFAFSYYVIELKSNVSEMEELFLESRARKVSKEELNEIIQENSHIYIREL